MTHRGVGTGGAGSATVLTTCGALGQCLLTYLLTGILETHEGHFPFSEFRRRQNAGFRISAKFLAIISSSPGPQAPASSRMGSPKWCIWMHHNTQFWGENTCFLGRADFLHRPHREGTYPSPFPILLLPQLQTIYNPTLLRDRWSSSNNCHGWSVEFIAGVVRLGNVPAESLGFLPGRRVLPQAVRGGVDQCKMTAKWSTPSDTDYKHRWLRISSAERLTFLTKPSFLSSTRLRYRWPVNQAPTTLPYLDDNYATGSVNLSRDLPTKVWLASVERLVVMVTGDRFVSVWLTRIRLVVFNPPIGWLHDVKINQP